MKTCWDFLFECTNIQFERVHKFVATITAKQAKAFGISSQAFDARVIIEPVEKHHHPTSKQTGSLKIVLPGDNKETRGLAFWLSKQVEQQITFSQGEMKIIYGAIGGEHQPDTAEEAEQLGDEPYFAEIQMVEVPPTPTFDGLSLQKVSGHPLIGQFNAAKQAKNPIDQFLGFFKVLEDFYGPTSKKVKLATALKTSTELLHLAQAHLTITENSLNKKLTKDEFTHLVEKLVKTRHECAHLRTSEGFGIAHGNSRVATEVKPLMEPLRGLAYEAIKMRLSPY